MYMTARAKWLDLENIYSFSLSLSLFLSLSLSGARAHTHISGSLFLSQRSLRRWHSSPCLCKTTRFVVLARFFSTTKAWKSLVENRRDCAVAAIRLDRGSTRSALSFCEERVVPQPPRDVWDCLQIHSSLLATSSPPPPPSLFLLSSWRKFIILRIRDLPTTGVACSNVGKQDLVCRV